MIYEGIFLLTALIQIVFWGIFWTLLAYKKVPDQSEAIPVTVLVCAHNEALNLPKLLENLEKQEYPNFEVIVVNDRSQDDSAAILENCQKNWPALKVIHIQAVPKGINPKKNALMKGLDSAQGEIILLSDADCYPASSAWISTMRAHFDGKSDIVLGMSPYEKHPGLLNRFIQFETFYTALQYLGLAKVGLVYMGVGRNLAYRKKVFEENRKKFEQILPITGGDDDLWIGLIGKKNNTRICLDPRSYVYSRPKKTWDSWWKQKKRHLSVGKYYKAQVKLVLALLHLSSGLFWLLGGLILLLGMEGSRSLWVWSLFLTREFLIIGLGFQFRQKYNLSLYVLELVCFEFLHHFYIFITGIKALSQKTISWD